MRQSQVDKVALQNAAAMVRDADFGSLFGEDFVGESGATALQLELAQKKITDWIQSRADRISP